MDTNELLRRASDTICGYIGGNPDLPATCSSGSHCVLDTEHSAVGCCPDNAASCTAGVYTGCVDGDSSAQTEVNPYVYTCSAGSVCYKNEFSGGYYQYGCGSASDMGTAVAMSATGMSALLDLSSLQVSFSETAQSSTSVSSTSSVPLSTSSASTKAEAHSSASSSYSSSSTSPASLSTPTTSSKLPSSGDRDRAGIIIGVTISSVAGLIAICALLIFFFWKRHGGGRRIGPGSRGGGIGSLSPASGNFQALHGTAEDFETGLRPEMAQAEPPTPKRRTSYGRWPFSDDADEDEAWVTPAIGPAATAAIAAAAAKRGRGAGASDPRQAPESSYRGVTTAAASTLRPKSPATSPPMTGMPTPPPAAVYFQMSPYGGGVHEPEEQLPLTYERTEFTRSGQLAALSRIGEESDDSMGSGGGDGDEYGDINTRSGDSHMNRARKLSFGDDPEELQVKSRLRGGGESGTNSTGSGVGAVSTAAGSMMDMDSDLTKGDSGLAEMPGTPKTRSDGPLWQQNRQRNRNGQ